MIKPECKKYVIVLTTAPDGSVAQSIADALVTEKLAACVNIIPSVQSVFWWEERIQHEPEIMLVIKTIRDRRKTLEKRLKELHPYDVPEVIVLNVFGGSEEYLKWICNSVNP